MRWLEVRRHSLTKMGPARGSGSHLSAAGVALARRVGSQLGHVDYVMTSSSPRAVETAIAMGFAVDITVDLPNGYVPGEVDHHEQWTWPRPYVSYAELIRQGRGVAAVAEVHRAVWVGALSALQDGQLALFVSHGGALEPALVACLPAADHTSWGAPFAHCDGARLTFDGECIVAIEFRRAHDGPRLPRGAD